MKLTHLLLRTSLLTLAVVPAYTQVLSLAARDTFNVAVREFEAGQFIPAARSFEKVIEQAPTLLQARVYLAAALVQAYTPNDPSPENAATAESAIAACLDVLKRDATNIAATDSLATLYFQMGDFIRSKEWNLKVISIDPKSKTSLYMLGAIAWSGFSEPLRAARLSVGLAPGDPGPIGDSELRQKLRDENLQSLTEGIDFERAALDIDPQFASAMLAMASLLRARADLGTSEEYASDIKEAETWTEKVRKIVAAEK